MKIEDEPVLLVELKYCERCGGLWLRVVGAKQPFCASCVVAMKEFPAPRGLRRHPHLPVGKQGTEVEAAVDFFGEGAHLC